MKIYFVLSCLCALVCVGCGQRQSDDQTVAFMAIGQSTAEANVAFASERVQVEPAQPVATIVDRRGNATFRLINTGTTPLAVAKLDTSCSTCRITNRVPRKIPAGESVTVEVRIAVGLLEELPSKRYVQVVYSRQTMRPSAALSPYSYKTNPGLGGYTGGR